MEQKLTRHHIFLVSHHRYVPFPTTKDSWRQSRHHKKAFIPSSLIQPIHAIHAIHAIHHASLESASTPRSLFSMSASPYQHQGQTSAESCKKEMVKFRTHEIREAPRPHQCAWKMMNHSKIVPSSKKSHLKVVQLREFSIPNFGWRNTPLYDILSILNFNKFEVLPILLASRRKLLRPLRFPSLSITQSYSQNPDSTQSRTKLERSFSMIWMLWGFEFGSICRIQTSWQKPLGRTTFGEKSL